MVRNLVIVESPAKAKTINHYLGADYMVVASVGHVRDLPPKELGVDVEQGFVPTYVLNGDKKKVLQEIRAAAKDSQHIYLATDPDREGEAIAWHVMQAANLDPQRTQRVAFFQVTKQAVQEAMQQPRKLDEDLVDAQQARRVLDRLVGYKISPLLSRSMHKPLSAGRVQSVALRLVVEREREILAFVPVEYWTLEADLQRQIEGKERFRARLLKIKGEDAKIDNQAQIETMLQVLQKAAYKVVKVEEGTRRQGPQPPFVTSTLQSTASSRLHFAPRQTMRLAQQLYEGIELDGERVGLITYMRTDSPHVAPEAQQEAHDYIVKTWGQPYAPGKPPEYQAKASGAQEAHEAIRPTSVLRTPEAMRAHLDQRQARLYELIWRRFVASQMAPAVWSTVSADILAARHYVFRATGRTLRFEGFLAVWEEKREDQVLPPLHEGETPSLIELLPEQHFTEPPPRYSEATLIRALEEHGVGRPSTYASIVGVIQDRKYVNKQDSRLRPTSLGMIVCDTLVATFAEIMQVGYTAQMEQELDEIAEGKLAYRTMLERFYQGLSQALAEAPATLPGALEQALWADMAPEMQERICPRCHKPLQMRISADGRFLGCSGYPDCRYVLDLSDPAHPKEPSEEEKVYAEGKVCAKCGSRMQIVTYKGSQFLGCEHYPKCKYTEPILSEQILDLAGKTACPDCGRRPLEPKSGRYGEYLYCPVCKKNWSLRKLGLGKAAAEKVDVACPACGERALEKRAGRYGPYYHCTHCNQNISEKKLAASLDEG